MSDTTAATDGGGSGRQDGSGPDAAREPPESLNITKLRSQHAGRHDAQEAMSPTTSVKALLADTNAAPPPPSSPSQASTSAFEQQQAALRRRKTAGSGSKKDNEERDDRAATAAAGTRQLGKDDESLKDNGDSLPSAPLVDGRVKPGASHAEGARPTFQHTLQDLRQFLLHFLRALPFKGFQSYLKKLIGPIVRLFVRGVAKILHRGQFGLASNLAFDIQLLLWKVVSPEIIYLTADVSLMQS